MSFVRTLSVVIFLAGVRGAFGAESEPFDGAQAEERVIALAEKCLAAAGRLNHASAADQKFECACADSQSSLTAEDLQKGRDCRGDDSSPRRYRPTFEIKYALGTSNGEQLDPEDLPEGLFPDQELKDKNDPGGEGWDRELRLRARGEWLAIRPEIERDLAAARKTGDRAGIERAQDVLEYMDKQFNFGIVLLWGIHHGADCFNLNPDLCGVRFAKIWEIDYAGSQLSDAKAYFKRLETYVSESRDKIPDFSGWKDLQEFQRKFGESEFIDIGPAVQSLSDCWENKTSCDGEVLDVIAPKI